MGAGQGKFDIFSGAWVSILTILWHISYLLATYLAAEMKRSPAQSGPAEAPAVPSARVQGVLSPLCFLLTSLRFALNVSCFRFK